MAVNPLATGIDGTTDFSGQHLNQPPAHPGVGLNAQPGALGPNADLDRENPLPLVERDITNLYTEPHSARDRHLGLMALGEHQDWT